MMLILIMVILIYPDFNSFSLYLRVCFSLDCVLSCVQVFFQVVFKFANTMTLESLLLSSTSTTTQTLNRSLSFIPFKSYRLDIPKYR